MEGPRSLPDLREWLVNQWRPGRPFAATAPATIRMQDDKGDLAVAGEHLADWNRGVLADSALWWVSEEMVDLIETTSADLPAVDLSRQLLPCEDCLVVFARPIQGADAESGEPILVDAFCWGAGAKLPDWETGGHRPGIIATAYRRVRFEDGLTPSEIAHATVIDSVRQQGFVGPGTYTLKGEMWLPLGRTDWRFGDDWSVQLSDAITALAAASLSEDRRWLATLWLLATQPNVVDLTDQVPTRPERRRAQRANLSDPLVRVVALRRSVYEGAEASREPGPGRTYRVRWPVRAHWRNQAYGPGRAYRRPTLIAPYIKGPEGAPLKKGSTVHVLKGEL